jgi:hypothetical protein
MQITATLPVSLWDFLESPFFTNKPPEVLYGAIAFFGFPDAAQEYWQRAREEERERIVRATILRATIPETDPRVLTYCQAFIMANDLYEFVV